MKMLPQWPVFVRGAATRHGGENIASNGGTPDQIYRARAGLPSRTVQLQCSAQARTHLGGPKCQTDRGRTEAVIEREREREKIVGFVAWNIIGGYHLYV